MPTKFQKFNERKDKREAWMTDELLQLVNTKMTYDVYVDWKKNSKTLDIYNEKNIYFRAFDKIVYTQIEETKRTYYYNTLQNYKFCMKKNLGNN